MIPAIRIELRDGTNTNVTNWPIHEPYGPAVEEAAREAFESFMRGISQDIEAGSVYGRLSRALAEDHA